MLVYRLFVMNTAYQKALSILLMEEIRRSPVEVGSLSHHLQGFKHSRRLFGISEPSTRMPFKHNIYLNRMYVVVKYITCPSNISNCCLPKQVHKFKKKTSKTFAQNLAKCHYSICQYQLRATPYFPSTLRGPPTVGYGDSSQMLHPLARKILVRWL